jgi:ABC-type transport system substrate-binding protein
LNPKFRIDCRAVSQPALLADLRGRRLPLFVYRWMLDYPDPDNAVEPFLYSKGFFASALGYSNPRADAMVEAARGELDQEKRRALYGELQALAIYDSPMLFTAQANGALARRPRIQGWLRNPMLPDGSLYEVTKLP